MLHDMSTICSLKQWLQSDFFENDDLVKKLACLWNFTKTGTVSDIQNDCRLNYIYVKKVYM